ncbi:hypothetical protein [Alcanivorax sp.]|jgi:hypothetical protein|uniref:hypothetical protein n=1 Tax=Alcanivorax sp. TaxID=1872427 RepID=UPI0032D9258D
MATQARVAGTVKIDGVAAARDVIVIKDDPAGRQVVADGHSEADGTFDITYSDWAGSVVVLALDEYGDEFTTGTALNMGQVVHPATPNGYVYKVTAAGTTGTEEPTWPTTGSVQSGGVTFAPRPYYRPIASGPLQGDVATVQGPASLFLSGEPGVWLDPGDISTLFQDAEGTIPVRFDGDPVGLILDKSGNNNHVGQSGSRRPVYRVIGGRGQIQFGHSKFLQGLPVSVFSGDYTALWAGWVSDDNSVGVAVSTGKNVSRLAFYVDTRTSPRRLALVSVVPGDTYCDLPIDVGPAPHVFVSDRNGLITRGWLDHMEASPSSIQIAERPDNNVLYIGYQFAGGVYFDGFFSGLIATSVLNDSVREDMRTWLAERAGMQL